MHRTNPVPVTEPTESIRASGLDDVVAAHTRLSHVDGEAGVLLLHGYPVEQLAPEVSFEETLHLFLHHQLPSATQLRSFRQELATQRSADPWSRRVLDAAPSDAALDALVAAQLSCSAAAQHSAEHSSRCAIRLVALFPTLVAAAQRHRRGLPPIEPREELSQAANFLWMLHEREPAAAEVRALDTYWNTVVDHGLNASTFTARVVRSTGADLLSAVLSAFAALRGPLHGGAPGPALALLQEIEDPERAESVIRGKLEAGERLMGFGHRVYRVRDPRAEVLAQACSDLRRAQGPATGDPQSEQTEQSGARDPFFALAQSVEETALRLLAERHPERTLATNVEYYTAMLLHSLGLDADIFTALFASARLAGWLAHCEEQCSVGRLVRPSSRFVGDVRSVPA